MKISVITVCYNAVGTIEKTIENVLSQTYNNIEYVVVDGCSNDGTLDIIKKYSDKIAKYVSEKDEGIYDAMNKGIALSTGDYVIFINANDTFYSDDVIEKVITAIEKNSDSKFVFGNANYVREDNSSYIEYFSDRDVIPNLYFGNICHQSIFYHKSLFEKYGVFDKNIKILADWDYNCKILIENKEKSLFIDIPVCNFQLGGLSSNEKTDELCREDCKNLREKYFSNIKKLKYEIKLRKLFGSIYKKRVFHNFFQKWLFGKNDRLNMVKCSH